MHTETAMAADNLVLVVDDDPQILDLFQEILDPQYFEVIPAMTAAEARQITHSKSGDIDVLVLDIHLPDEDGFSLFTELRDVCPDSETVIITGKGTAEKAVRAMKLGAFDFIEKPFNPLEVNQTLRNAIERKRFRKLTAELATTKRHLEAELILKTFQIDQVRELVNFSRVVNEHLRLDAILDLTYERLPDLVNFDTFSLFLYHGESKEFHLAITNRPNLDPRAPIIVKEEDSQIMQKALRTQQVLFIDDVERSGFLPEENANQRMYRKQHSVCLPLKVEDRPIGVLNLNDFRSEEHIQEYINIAVLAAAYLAPVISNAMLYSQIEETANRDGLTQLYNRGFFDRSINENFRRSKRYGRPLSLLFLDIDHFKRFNDAHGHQAGDTVLRRVATKLSDNMRQGIDIVARYGGEEMVLIAPETGADGIMILAERIRFEIEQMLVPITEDSQTKQLSVTVSVGTATLLPGVHEFENERALIEAADLALYEAKHRGRNRCMHFTPTDVERTRDLKLKGA